MKNILTPILIFISVVSFAQKPTVQQYLSPNSSTANFGTKKSFVVGDGTGNDTLWIDGWTFGEIMHFVANGGIYHALLDTADVLGFRLPVGAWVFKQADTTCLVGYVDLNAVVPGLKAPMVFYTEPGVGEGVLATRNGVVIRSLGGGAAYSFPQTTPLDGQVLAALPGGTALTWADIMDTLNTYGLIYYSQGSNWLPSDVINLYNQRDNVTNVNAGTANYGDMDTIENQQNTTVSGTNNFPGIHRQGSTGINVQDLTIDGNGNFLNVVFFDSIYWANVIGQNNLINCKTFVQSTINGLDNVKGANAKVRNSNLNGNGIFTNGTYLDRVNITGNSCTTCTTGTNVYSLGDGNTIDDGIGSNIGMIGNGITATTDYHLYLGDTVEIVSGIIQSGVSSLDIKAGLTNFRDGSNSITINPDATGQIQTGGDLEIEVVDEGGFNITGGGNERIDFDFGVKTIQPDRIGGIGWSLGSSGTTTHLKTIFVDTVGGAGANDSVSAGYFKNIYVSGSSLYVGSAHLTDSGIGDGKIYQSNSGVASWTTVSSIITNRCPEYASVAAAALDGKVSGDCIRISAVGFSTVVVID